MSALHGLLTNKICMKILVGEKDVFELQDLVSIELIWMEPVLLETGSKQGCYVDFAFDFTKASSRQFLEVENSGYGPDTAQSGMSSAMVIPTRNMDPNAMSRRNNQTITHSVSTIFTLGGPCFLGTWHWRGPKEGHQIQRLFIIFLIVCQKPQIQGSFIVSSKCNFGV